ncbi:MAG: hypothetical protein WEE89_14100 [Gemmatimonadota bacterium]
MKRYMVWALPILLAGCSDLSGIDDFCEVEEDFTETFSTVGLDRVRILAEAGHLRVEGRAGLNEVRIFATACARDSRDLEDIELVVQRSGTVGRIFTLVPVSAGVNARLDLRIEVPDWMLLEIDHQDGEIEVDNVSGVDIYDTSGDIALDNIFGDVAVNDDDGNILIDEVDGDLYIWDDSGLIDARDIGGEVLVEEDGSGNLIVRNVNLDVYIMEDGSGDILVENVGGDFTVDFDFSGNITYRNVRGRVLLP